LVEIELLLSVLEEARLIVVDIKLDVLCYSSKELPLKHAVSCLIIPSLTDQLNILQNFMLPNLLAQHPQVRQWVHLSSYIHFPWFYYSTMIPSHKKIIFLEIIDVLLFMSFLYPIIAQFQLIFGVRLANTQFHIFTLFLRV
jgi:hypothetical protein